MISTGQTGAKPLKPFPIFPTTMPKRFLESILAREITEGVHLERATKAKAQLEKMYPEFAAANQYGFSVRMEPTGEASEFLEEKKVYLCLSYNSQAKEEKKELFLKLPIAVCGCPIGFRKTD